MPDRVDTLDATVPVTLKGGEILNRQIIGSTGLMTDPTPDVHFGLGQVNEIESVEIVTLNGAQAEILSPAIDGTVMFNS